MTMMQRVLPLAILCAANLQSIGASHDQLRIQVLSKTEEDAEIKIFDPLAMLTQSTLKPNLKAADGPQHWFVYYHAKWDGDSDELGVLIRKMAVKYEKTQNKDDWFATNTRFGHVDCERFKSMCNDYGIRRYPWVTHFYMGVAVADWTIGHGTGKNDGQRLANWLAEEVAIVDNYEPDWNTGLWLDIRQAQLHPILGLFQLCVLGLVFSRALIPCFHATAESCKVVKEWIDEEEEEYRQWELKQKARRAAWEKQEAQKKVHAATLVVKNQPKEKLPQPKEKCSTADSKKSKQRVAAN